MGTIIQAAELNVGDLYVTYSSTGRDRAGEAEVRQITGRRVVRSVETYAVLETLALDGTRRGEISLRAEHSVERLDSAGSVADLTAALQYMPSGDTLFVAYFEGRYYA